MNSGGTRIDSVGRKRGACMPSNLGLGVRNSLCALHHRPGKRKKWNGQEEETGGLKGGQLIKSGDACCEPDKTAAEAGRLALWYEKANQGKPAALV